MLIYNGLRNKSYFKNCHGSVFRKSQNRWFFRHFSGFSTFGPKIRKKATFRPIFGLLESRLKAAFLAHPSGGYNKKEPHHGRKFFSIICYNIPDFYPSWGPESSNFLTQIRCDFQKNGPPPHFGHQKIGLLHPENCSKTTTVFCQTFHPSPHSSLKTYRQKCGSKSAKDSCQDNHENYGKRNMAEIPSCRHALPSKEKPGSTFTGTLALSSRSLSC